MEQWQRYLKTGKVDIEIGEMYLVRGPGKFFEQDVPEGMCLAYAVVRSLGQFQTVTMLFSSRQVDDAVVDYWQSDFRRMIERSFEDRLLPRVR